MPAAVNNIYIEQGATYRQRFQILAPPISPAPAGLPVDLTGWIFTGSVKKTATKDDFEADFVITVLDQTQTATKGFFEAVMAAATTAQLPVPTSSKAIRTTVDYAYDIYAQPPGGDKIRLLEGVATVSPEVTS